MAKCDLSIELDEPDRVYVGGDVITGTLHVMADSDVNCTGLEIQANWRTHGRGNVARGKSPWTTLFVGQWLSGQRESYRFELEVSDWPPSYHGNFINVDHYVDARAKIPWAFDPKASQEFLMRPISGPDPAKTKAPSALGGCIGYGVFLVVISFFVVGMGGMVVGLLTNPIVALIVGLVVFPIIALIAARSLLPKWLLGDVQVELITPHVAPGQRVRATFSFQPRRSFKLNAITADLKGTEVCVSGSGSNRTTHRNVFFEQQHVLQEGARLEAGQRQEFELDFKLPGDVPYSFDLSDNNLNWTIGLRVDIPRWPDWTKTLKLHVYPDRDAVQPAAAIESDNVRGHSDDPAVSVGGGADSPSAKHDEITFAETATHLWQLRGDAEQIDVLVDAVTGMTFEIDTYVERRLLYSGDEDPHLYKGGYAVWARHSDPPLPLVLYVPHDLGDEFEQAGRDLWHCRGTIVGWDHQHRRLQIKVLVGDG
ncbi:hypothetical protein NHH03_08975 [Stieleria sp. TO1_6]|uniref:hypothetical protein n=1 Tax=Stieleria tagensis TaxID=2956795 RepID=UPI00209A9401|nr:hypothetical protein [Stieleria tagensis]MCO8121866.1 hypothetical protein [Stieleria tagensis]